MIVISIKRPFSKLITRLALENTARQALVILTGRENFDLTVVIGSDTLLHDLNNQYRGIDKPTDVLSFESNESDPETGLLNLGDIIISYQSAENQAAEAKHPVLNEIQLLLIHGILHLLGHDHNTQVEKQIMWKKQKEVLDSMGILINRISGDDEFHD